MDIKNKIEFLSEIYRNSQNMTSFADSKANMSLSIQSLLISIGLGASLIANTFKTLNDLGDENLSFLFYLLVTGFIITSIVGIFLSMNVYIARSPLESYEQKRNGLMYYGHISRYNTYNEYYLKIKDIDEDRILKEYTQQVFSISKIAKKKMSFVNKSIYFLIINLCLTLLLIIASAYISTLNVVGG